MTCNIVVVEQHTAQLCYLCLVMVLETMKSLLYELILYSTSTPVGHKSMWKLIGLLGVGWARRINRAKFSQTSPLKRGTETSWINSLILNMDWMSRASFRKCQVKQKPCLRHQNWSWGKSWLCEYLLSSCVGVPRTPAGSSRTVTSCGQIPPLHPSLRPVGGFHVIPHQLTAWSWNVNNFLSVQILCPCYYEDILKCVLFYTGGWPFWKYDFLHPTPQDTAFVTPTSKQLHRKVSSIKTCACKSKCSLCEMLSWRGIRSGVFSQPQLNHRHADL